ncbi:MAG: hypothetical protein IJ840_03860, partial [Bacteroidales bacterium]|nr:hypothetical protein [Bacteroidales bacterium]
GTCDAAKGITCAGSAPAAGHVAHAVGPHGREAPRRRDMWCGGRHHMCGKRPGSGICGAAEGTTCAGNAPAAGHVAHAEAPHAREAPRRRDMWCGERYHMCGKRPGSGTCDAAGDTTCAGSTPAEGHVAHAEAPHVRRKWGQRNARHASQVN